MDLLVIGGTGVISYAVVCEAVRQGIHVTCINRGISKKQQLPDSVEQIHADYRDRDAMTRVLSGRMFDAALDVLCYKKEDIRYSVSILKDVCKQYFFFSSCAVYNKGKGDYECTEDSELINPVWDYSIKKVECEKELLSLAQSEGFTYTIVRPAVTYGNTRIPYGITPPYGYHGTIIQRILHKKPIIVWDNGEAYSTITHVDDFAVGFVGLIGNPKAFNQFFHIVGDYHYHWKDVLFTLGNILGVEPVLFNLTKEQYASELPYRKGELLGGRGITQLLDNSTMISVWRSNTIGYSCVSISNSRPNYSICDTIFLCLPNQSSLAFYLINTILPNRINQFGIFSTFIIAFSFIIDCTR